MRCLVLPLLAAFSLAACTHGAYDGDWNYAGQDWSGDLGELDRLDPWLEDTGEGHVIVERALGRGGWHPEAVRALNIRFRHFADVDGDLRLTDEEIRLALIRCAAQGWS